MQKVVVAAQEMKFCVNKVADVEWTSSRPIKGMFG